MLEGMKQKVREFLSNYFGSLNANESEEGYVEWKEPIEESKKILVKPIELKKDTDIDSILNSLRKGNFIAILDIKHIKENDLDHLKKVIDKLKKTCRAINGDIAGIGDNFIAATPAYVKIYRRTKNK